MSLYVYDMCFIILNKLYNMFLYENFLGDLNFHDLNYVLVIIHGMSFHAKIIKILNICASKFFLKSEAGFKSSKVLIKSKYCISV